MYLPDLYTGCDLRNEVHLLKANIYNNFIVKKGKPIDDPTKFKAFCKSIDDGHIFDHILAAIRTVNSRGEMLGLRVCKSIANPVTNSKFATICTDLHACKLLVCTRGKLRGKCGNGREAVRRKSVANPLQTNYFATNLHACKLNANTKFASDLHIRKSADYIKLANGL